MKVMTTLLAGAFALTAGNLWAASGSEDSIERLRLHTDAGSIKWILNGVVVVVAALWVCNLFGLFHTLSRYRVGH